MIRNLKLAILSLLVVSISTTGCLLQTLSTGDFQRLILYFRLTQKVAAGGPVDVHMVVYPNEVKLKRQFVKISGMLEMPPGAALPDSVEVTVVGVDVETGAPLHRFSVTVPIRGDGSFSREKRFKKNIPAGTMQTITLETRGGEIPKDAEVAVCVDVAKKKRDFARQRSCISSSSASPGEPGLVHVDVLDNSFQPKRITIQPGDTVRWTLRGSDPSHTTTAMAGNWDSGFVFNMAGSFFERTFPPSENGLTFEYFCATHRDCCAMQGSVRVGENAPDPGDGY